MKTAAVAMNALLIFVVVLVVVEVVVVFVLQKWGVHYYYHYYYYYYCLSLFRLVRQLYRSLRGLCVVVDVVVGC